MLDPHFQALFEAIAAATPPDSPPLEHLPVEIVREWYRGDRAANNVKTTPSDVESKDIKAGEVPARLYTPAQAVTPGPCLIYFHGGGWVIGDLDTHDAHCRRLATMSGSRVMAVDYRLAPEHPFPASYDDALAATVWVFDHGEQIGVDPMRIGVGGCSAGGNLAASVAIDLRTDAKRNLKFQLLLYPALTPAEPTVSRLEPDGPVLTAGAMTWFEASLAAEGHLQALRAAPAQVSNLRDLPPALVTTAGYDMLRDEGRDFALRLRSAGVAAQHLHYPSLAHDFYTMGDISPAVVDAARVAAEAVKAAL